MTKQKQDEARNACIKLALLVDYLDDLTGDEIRQNGIELITDAANEIAKAIGYNGEWCELIEETIHTPVYEF